MLWRELLSGRDGVDGGKFWRARESEISGKWRWKAGIKGEKREIMEGNDRKMEGDDGKRERMEGNN